MIRDGRVILTDSNSFYTNQNTNIKTDFHRLISWKTSGYRDHKVEWFWEFFYTKRLRHDPLNSQQTRIWNTLLLEQREVTSHRTSLWKTKKTIVGTVLLHVVCHVLDGLFIANGFGAIEGPPTLSFGTRERTDQMGFIAWKRDKSNSAAHFLRTWKIQTKLEYSQASQMNDKWNIRFFILIDLESLQRSSFEGTIKEVYTPTPIEQPRLSSHTECSDILQFSLQSSDSCLEDEGILEVSVEAQYSELSGSSSTHDWLNNKKEKEWNIRLVFFLRLPILNKSLVSLYKGVWRKEIFI